MMSAISSTEPRENELPNCASSTPGCWRTRDVQEILEGDDKVTKLQLLRFRPFNDRFASFMKIDLSPPSNTRHSLGILEPELINVLRSQANTIMIASGLSTTSRLNFLDLFEDFVLEALGLSPQRLQNFRQQYESLSNLLYSELLRKSGATEHVKQLIVDLQNSESDPFVCLAVESALKSYRDERCSILQLDFKFIIEPLRQVLFGAEPVTYILLQLQVLAIRFKKYYRGAHVNWSSHFDVQTEFLQEVCRKEPSHIAMSLSQDNQNLFGQLTDQALKDSDNDVVRNLFERWDYLTSSVEECMATTAGMRNKIRQIAKSLHSSKNYHSLAAVVRGIESSGHAVDKRYRFIANQDGNYEVYRRMVKTQRHQVAIHYLFPIMREIQSREDRKQRTWKKLQEAGDPERQWKLRMKLVNLEEDDIAGSVVLASKSYVAEYQSSWLPSFASFIPACMGY
ncbi:hypothetical protein LCP963914a_9857 [Penicillium roqueforti]|nr:hypothetical protein LCP963914a_9857 [Penicillium roqueforti]